MAYSNGYNHTAVLAKLFGRLAWRTDSTLNTANKTSASGRYFDDGSFHALVTATNVKDTMAAIVSPETLDTAFASKQNAVILRTLNAVFNEPEYKEQTHLYERFSEIESDVPNSGKAIGYRVQLAKAFDISVQINALELYLNGAQTFNVYLFKQGSVAPIKTKSVTTVASTKTTVDLSSDPWILNYKESAIYYVVYFQDDLVDVEAIQEQACFQKTLMFKADPFYAETSGTTFDRTQPAFTVDNPNGLNMLVTSFKDFTQNILNQPHLFDELIGLSMAYQVIEDMIYSVRSTKNERIVKDQLDKVGIQLDLNGAAPISDSPQVVGLKQRIDREAKRVKAAFYPKPKGQTVNLDEC
jgi:hypothetical protein